MHESLQLYDVQSCESYFGYGSQWAFLSFFELSNGKSEIDKYYFCFRFSKNTN